jgi:hypothetical protein
MYRSGQDINKLRRDIGIPEEVVAAWQASDPSDHDAELALKYVVPFRRKVMALFERMVAEHSNGSESAAAANDNGHGRSQRCA